MCDGSVLKTTDYRQIGSAFFLLLFAELYMSYRWRYFKRCLYVLDQLSGHNSPLASCYLLPHLPRADPCRPPEYQFRAKANNRGSEARSAEASGLKVARF